MQDAGLHATEHLEARPGFLARNLDGPLAARLGLEGVGLVYDPVPHGWQYPPLCHDVTEQKRMIGHHDVGARGPTPRAVEKALVWKVRAAAAKALPWRGRKHLAGDVSPADAQRVEIAVGRLARKRVGHRDGGKHVR